MKWLRRQVHLWMLQHSHLQSKDIFRESGIWCAVWEFEILTLLGSGKIDEQRNLTTGRGGDGVGHAGWCWAHATRLSSTLATLTGFYSNWMHILLELMWRGTGTRVRGRTGSFYVYCFPYLPDGPQEHSRFHCKSHLINGGQVDLEWFYGPWWSHSLLSQSGRGQFLTLSLSLTRTHTFPTHCLVDKPIGSGYDYSMTSASHKLLFSKHRSLIGWARNPPQFHPAEKRSISP